MSCAGPAETGWCHSYLTAASQLEGGAQSESVCTGKVTGGVCTYILHREPNSTVCLAIFVKSGNLLCAVHGLGDM